MDTGEPSTQDTFKDINTGEVGDNRGDDSFRTCEVNTLINVAITAGIAMLEDNLIYLYLKARHCKY